VVTNVEMDHVDFYRGGVEEMRSAFAVFLGSAGRGVVCGDDAGARAALVGSGCDAVTYGTAPENGAVLTIEDCAPGHACGRLETDDGVIPLKLRVPGAHNLLNASAAASAAHMVGVDLETCARALAAFGGVRRRFEYRGRARGAVFYDDYAHHPTEISATLAAAHSEGSRRIVAVFQPHRYSRTEAMWRQMGESLAGADVTVVTDVYGAGEAPRPGVSGKLLVDALAEHDPLKRLVYLPRRPDIVRFLMSEVRAGDLVLTLGAGDITMVADETLERLGGH
jgi:UDP-N-acetylmuramate--alanine ligase